jgi:hypothetical protein
MRTWLSDYSHQCIAHLFGMQAPTVVCGAATRVRRGHLRLNHKRAVGIGNIACVPVGGSIATVAVTLRPDLELIRLGFLSCFYSSPAASP